MKAADIYYSVDTVSEGLYKEKGSKFIAYVIPCDSAEKAKSHLDELWKRNPGACHVCFAWRFGINEGNYKDRFSDDGEPSNSAGKPIFGQILSFDVTNILIAVVRFYGGTNLGVGGLINAYRTAAKSALETAKICEYQIEDSFELIFPYENMGLIMNLMKKNEIRKIQQGFEGNQAKITVEIRQSKTESFTHQLDKIHTLHYKKLT